MPTKMLIRGVKTLAFERSIRRLATTGPNARRLAGDASKRFVQRGSSEISGQYKNMLNQIGNVLDDPAGAGLNRPDVGGSRTVDLKDYSGNDFEVSTVSWKPLSPVYSASNPRSFQFWKKSRNGKILGGRPASLSDTYRRAVSSIGDVTVTPGQLKELSLGDKSRFVMRLSFKPPSLPGPLNAIINEPFVSGKVTPTLKLLQTYSRNDIGVIAYPEHFRPLLSTIAAAFSNRIVVGLKKATTGLNR